MLFNDEHLLKASYSIVFKVAGSETFLRFLLLSKVLYPIAVTFFPLIFAGIFKLLDFPVYFVTVIVEPISSYSKSPLFFVSADTVTTKVEISIKMQRIIDKCFIVFFIILFSSFCFLQLQLYSANRKKVSNFFIF